MHKILGTRNSRFNIFAAADSTSTVLDALAKSASIPTGAINLSTIAGGPALTATAIDFMPVGVGTAGDTFVMQVIGWSYDFTNSKWMPQELCQVTCTLSSVVDETGVKTCDSIVVVADHGVEGTELVCRSRSTGFSQFTVDSQGVELLTVDYARGTVTNVNTYVRVR